MEYKEGEREGQRDRKRVTISVLLTGYGARASIGLWREIVYKREKSLHKIN